jgi:hypothetical protein
VKRNLSVAILTSALSAAIAFSPALCPQARADDFGGSGRIQHVLLISIDGFHALDYINCSQGISTINGGGPLLPESGQPRRASILIRRTLTGVRRPAPTAASSQSIPPNWSAIPLTIAIRFIPGTSFAIILF